MPAPEEAMAPESPVAMGKRAEPENGDAQGALGVASPTLKKPKALDCSVALTPAAAEGPGTPSEAPTKEIPKKGPKALFPANGNSTATPQAASGAASAPAPKTPSGKGGSTPAKSAATKAINAALKDLQKEVRTAPSHPVPAPPQPRRAMPAAPDSPTGKPARCRHQRVVATCRRARRWRPAATRARARGANARVRCQVAALGGADQMKKWKVVLDPKGKDPPSFKSPKGAPFANKDAVLCHLGLIPAISRSEAAAAASAYRQRSLPAHPHPRPPAL
jgi:hypothetical protein